MTRPAFSTIFWSAVRIGGMIGLVVLVSAKHHVRGIHPGVIAIFATVAAVIFGVAIVLERKRQAIPVSDEQHDSARLNLATLQACLIVTGIGLMGMPAVLTGPETQSHRVYELMTIGGAAGTVIWVIASRKRARKRG